MNISIKRLHKLLVGQSIADWEFVACYTLLHLQSHFSKRWICGVSNLPIPSSIIIPSIQLCDIPGMDMNGVNCDPSMPILQLFIYYNLKGIKRFVHQSIVSWGFGHRPYILMHHIPSPMDVHQMMMQGRRCISAFIDPENLKRTFKDNYPPFIERDSLSFMLHDIKHMEQFMDESHDGQIGFLRRCDGFVFSSLAYWYDQDFLDDITHLQSDMNASPIHLLKFLKARWIGVHKRNRPFQSFDAVFSILLSRWDIRTDNPMFNILKKICFKELDEAERHVINDFFGHISFISP